MRADPLLLLGKACRNWVAHSRPWTNVYGLGRSLLAAGTASTLIFSSSNALFRPAWGVSEVPICTGLSRIGVFCASFHHLELARWIAVIILVIVASGWRPRYMGLLHWWVSFSLATSAVMVDGGDQVTAVLTLLLLPVTLTDRRAWHWQNSEHHVADWKYLLAISSLVAVRIQVAGIYFHAAVGKLGVQEWTDGTALYYWITHPDFGASRLVWHLVEPLVRHGTTLALMTWGAIILELFLFAALVMPKKAWSYFLLAGLTFHAGIAIIHGLVSFSLAMAGALVLYLRPSEKPFIAPAFVHFKKTVRTISSYTSRTFRSS